MSASPIRLLGSLDGLPLYRSSMVADSDDTRATAQTVRKMCEHVSECLRDPAVTAAASTALARYGNVEFADLKRRAWAAWWYVRHVLKFVQDDTLLASMLNEHGQRELLNPPPVLLRMKRPQGDCDDYTMLVCALLKCLGVNFEIVTIAADPHEPERWSHVYAVAIVEGGDRFPMDTSHGKYPGWEVPREHMLRYQAWDETGEALAGRGPAVRSRLNGYMPRGLGRRPVRRRRGLFGLGQDAGSDPGASAVATANDFWSSIGTDIQALPADLGLSVTPLPSSGGSSALSPQAFSLANTFAGIFGKIVAPTTTITNPQGLSVQTPSGNAASVLSSMSPSLSATSSSSILMLALLGGGALLLIMMMKK